MFGLATLSFNARGLGATEFGVFALIQGFAALIGAVATFESWQPVVRFGLRLPKRLPVILSAGLALDLLAAVVATVLAVTILHFAATWAGVPDPYRTLAQLYCLTLLCGLSGTPKGYFRLTDRFDILAANQVLLALAQFLAAVALWWFDADLPAYVFVQSVIVAVYGLSLPVLMIFRQTRRNQPLRFVHPRDRIVRLLLRACLGSSLLSTFMASRRHLALLLVGGLLGPDPAGLYALAARLVAAVSRMSNLAMQVVFKPLAAAARQSPLSAHRTNMLRAFAFAAAIAVPIALGGWLLDDRLVALAGGTAFVGAATVFSLLLAAECISLCAMPLSPMIQARDGTRALVIIAGLGFAVHLSILPLFVNRLGLSGAGFAAVSVACLIAGLTLWHGLRRSKT